MAFPSQGIQQLIAGERKAVQIVTDARKKKVKRMKQAKVEAQIEIDQYIMERGKRFKEFEAKIMGTCKEEVASIEAEVKLNIEQMARDVDKNQESVIQAFMKLVYDVHPQLPQNFCPN